MATSTAKRPGAATSGARTTNKGSASGTVLPRPKIIESCCGSLAIVSEPTRLRVSFVLGNRGEASTTDLADACDMEVKTLAQHLARMVKAGLIVQFKVAGQTGNSYRFTPQGTRLWNAIGPYLEAS